MDDDIERETVLDPRRPLPAPRLLTHALRDVAAALIDAERANGTGLTAQLRTSYGDELVEQELARLRDVLSA
jgi:hypothetical protein